MQDTSRSVVDRPATPAFRYRLIAAAVLVYTAGVLMALLIPANPASWPDEMRAVVDAMARVVPMIDRLAEASRYSYPDKLRAVLAGYWLLVPILLVLCWNVAPFLDRRPSDFGDREPVVVLLQYTVGMTLLGLMVLHLVLAQPAVLPWCAALATAGEQRHAPAHVPHPVRCRGIRAAVVGHAGVEPGCHANLHWRPGPVLP